jgi:transposase
MARKNRLRVVPLHALGEGARAGQASASSPTAAAPNPQCRAPAKRQQVDTEYKLSILEEAERCSSPRALAALLRREGLRRSDLTTWRRERKGEARQAPGWQDGGKADLDSEQQGIAELQSRCARLERELEQTRLIVDVHNRLRMLLELPTQAKGKSTGS